LFYDDTIGLYCSGTLWNNDDYSYSLYLDAGLTQSAGTEVGYCDFVGNGGTWPLETVQYLNITAGPNFGMDSIQQDDYDGSGLNVTIVWSYGDASGTIYTETDTVQNGVDNWTTNTTMPPSQHSIKTTSQVGSQGTASTVTWKSTDGFQGSFIVNPDHSGSGAFAGADGQVLLNAVWDNKGAGKLSMPNRGPSTTFNMAAWLPSPMPGSSPRFRGVVHGSAK